MVQAENLSYSYTGSMPYVLSDITFNIQNGEYISVVGENGSGKSTLARLILRLLKPTCGSIVCHAKRIGYVPQKRDFSNANFPITVYEALHSYRMLLKLKDKSEIETRLNQVGLSGFQNSLMGSLSGGQHQKILIARALMGNPDLLLLDEPSTGVDPTSQRDIYAILKKLNQENGITIISIEHNLDAAVMNSTLIYHLVGGKGHLCSPLLFANEFIQNK